MPSDHGAGAAAARVTRPDSVLFRLLLSRVNDAGSYGVCLSAHLMTLYALARTSCGPIVECGVGSGFSTLALLAGAADAGLTVASYDIREEARGAALGTLQCEHDDPQVRHWTFTTKASHEAAADWADGVLGVLFLDTSHFYSETRRELSAWAPRMAPRGIMCGHDYLLHLDPMWQATGVKRAVDEFVDATGRYDLVVHRRDHGLFVLWPRDRRA